jgi:O-antigen/teichoic acid export membrane protein
MQIKNVLANAGGRLWGFITLFAFVPFYLHFLGIEGYALVSLYTVLVSILVFADMGFTATINREVARLSVIPSKKGKINDLLLSYEIIYCFISLGVFGVIWFVAPMIAQDWITSKSVSAESIETTIRLFGLALALQLPAGLYIGALMGLQLQVKANIVTAAWGAIRGIGSILVLWIFEPSVELFAGWQVIANVVYFVIARASIWKYLTKNSEQRTPKFSLSAVIETWRYSLGMMGMAIITMVTTQSGVIIVSKILDLESIGFYSLGVSLSMLPILIASPVVLAAFPRLAELVALNEFQKLKEMYFSVIEIVGVLSIPIGVILIIFTPEILLFWTGLDEISESLINVTRLLLLGQILQVSTVVPYYLLLANGNVRLTLMLGISSIALIIPMQVYCVQTFGLEGAGLGWLLLNIITIGPYVFFVHKDYMPAGLLRWAKNSLLLPATISFCFSLLGLAIQRNNGSSLLQIVIILSVWFLSVALLIIINKSLRNKCHSLLTRKRKKYVGNI